MRTIGALAIVVAVAGTVLADGFPIEHGRYKGKVTVLRLTPAQITSLASSRDLKLTSVQKDHLKVDTGVSPSEVYVYFSKDGENDHTCDAFNVAFRFSETEIEIPHEYVVSDAEAARRKQELEEM